MTLNSHQLPTVCPPLDCQLCTKSRREKRPGPHPGSTDNVSREVSAHQRRKKYQDCAYVFTVLYCAVQTEEKTVRVSESQTKNCKMGSGGRSPARASCQGRCSQVKWNCVLLPVAGGTNSVLPTALGQEQQPSREVRSR